jgi:hypothetical protein
MRILREQISARKDRSANDSGILTIANWQGGWRVQSSYSIKEPLNKSGRVDMRIISLLKTSNATTPGMESVEQRVERLPSWR